PELDRLECFDRRRALRAVKQGKLAESFAGDDHSEDRPVGSRSPKTAGAYEVEAITRASGGEDNPPGTEELGLLVRSHRGQRSARKARDETDAGKEIDQLLHTLPRDPPAAPRG